MDTKMLMPSRGCVAANYFLMTPDNFVANGLPHFAKTVARLLTTPRGTAARFGQYLSNSSPVAAACDLRAQASKVSSTRLMDTWS